MLVFLLICGQPAYSQNSDSLKQRIATDTIKNDFVSKVQKLAHDEAMRSIDKFEEDKIEAKQTELIDGIVKTTQAAKAFLKTGLDTSGFNSELTSIENWYTLVGDGIFTNRGSAQTYRNLETSNKILRELLDRTLSRKSVFDAYAKNLAHYKYKIDSLNSDTLLYKFPTDSANLVHYLQKMVVITRGILPADSALKKALVNVEELQKHLTLTVNKLTSDIEQIEGFKKEISDQTFDREFANLGGPVGFSRPFNEIVNFSRLKGEIALYFYSRNNVAKIMSVFLLVIFTSLFLRALKKQIQAGGLLQSDFSGQLVLRYPVLSALLIVLMLSQFIFSDPPFVFSSLFWIISGIALTVIFRQFITRYWMYAWLAMFILFLFACADNMILQASRPERWSMIALSLAGIVAGSTVLLGGKKSELREKWILYFIAFVIVLESASIIANFYGRYNLAKTLLTSGYFNVIIGILFLWTVRLVNEALSLASQIYKKPDRKLFYINFDRVGGKVPPLFYVLLFLGWLILFGRSFYSFKLVADPIRNFLFQERTVGEYSFSIKSVLIFFLILILSGITSRIVSFFASDKHDSHGYGAPSGKPGLGSWLLLIRIGIISTGVFLAFAASGMSMDRFAIVLGALSVGVGFGLQTLVNNLVSGLIIAFEKPVNVGDIVEIAGQSGTMKSIGFRSSVISRSEGADVVMPNGDLLNAHLVNWSMSGSRKQVSIIVAVDYATNIETASQITAGVMANDSRVMKHPKPVAFAKDFSNNAIEIQLLFWVQNVKEWPVVKGAIITAIDVAFKESGIKLSMQQQELFLHKVKETDAGQKEENAAD